MLPSIMSSAPTEGKFEIECDANDVLTITVSAKASETDENVSSDEKYRRVALPTAAYQ